MARPKKHDLERRNDEIKIRFTALEADHLQDQADKAGLPRAAYIRMRSLGERITVPRMRGINPAVIVELDRLTREINAIGVNVNQVARAMNAERRLPAGWDNIPAALEALQDKAETTLEKLALSDDA